MQAIKRTTGIILTAALSAMLFAGCSNNSNSSETGGNPSSPAASGGEGSAPPASDKEVVVLKYAVSADQAARQSTKDLLALVEKKLGNVKLEPIVIPGEGAEWNKKVTISLMAGDEMDVLYQNATTYQKFATANLIEPLDEMISQDNYDVDSIYGSSISKYNDKIYMLPAFRDVHVTMYNKNLFDEAHVPYPDNATWTWDKYVETAQAISKLGKGTYGSYMLDWDNYFMFKARQMKVPEYKPDGTSNYDDPAFAESMKFYGDLGNELKVQPDFITFKSKKMPWDTFLTTNNYGMFVVGNWAVQSAMDKKQYPRDWKLGVAIMPQIDAGGKTVMGIMGGYSVSSTSKHKKEAYEAVKVLAELQWTLPGNIPARVDLSAEEVNSIFQPMVDGLKDDGITVEELKAAILNPSLDIVSEKIVGPGMTQITSLIMSEGELYATKQRTLEQTMKELKEKADKAIAEDQSTP
ncbi:ABC transporter substrate-binding protein [Cohnella soli]|uniref:ABC transporter substrate-binding protein n=1 Tax=Cohnella soli TaxID=425005 RepID=A0ABW0HLX7_9BACL